jgi:hypothetical protein
MAEYVPFPTGEDEVVDDRRLTRKIVGCFGCGGLGVVGFFGVLVLLIGGLGAGTSGCDVDLGDPGEGTASQRLPVTVTPASGLGDDTTVRVTSDAFDPDTVVGVAVCLQSADTERRGVKACDETQGARYATDGKGRLDATYRVPRVITVGSKAYDCAATSKRCLVVAADASDYDESGGVAVTFRTGLPAAELTPVRTRPVTDHLPISADPSVANAPVAAGTDLAVAASGFQPGEPLLVAWCTPDLAEVGMTEACEPADLPAAVQAIMFRMVSRDFLTADAQGAITTTVKAKGSIVPIGDDESKALASLGSTTTTSSPATTSSTTRAGAPTTTAPLEAGAVRCGAADGGCSIVIAAAADTKRSAVLPYTVTS